MTDQQFRHYLKDFEITVWADADGFHHRVTVTYTDPDGFRVKTVLTEQHGFPNADDSENTAKIYIRKFIEHAHNEADKVMRKTLPVQRP